MSFKIRTIVLKQNKTKKRRTMFRLDGSYWRKLIIYKQRKTHQRPRVSEAHKRFVIGAWYISWSIIGVIYDNNWEIFQAMLSRFLTKLVENAVTYLFKSLLFFIFICLYNKPHFVLKHADSIIPVNVKY
jgi:hypothetical protein